MAIGIKDLKGDNGNGEGFRGECVDVSEDETTREVEEVCRKSCEVVDIVLDGRVVPSWHSLILPNQSLHPSVSYVPPIVSCLTA